MKRIADSNIVDQIKTDGKAGGRITSLDALRGFDMLWITGGENVVRRLCDIFPCAAAVVLKQQLDHIAWEGFHFYDLIFPLFLFIVGVVLPFSLTRHVEAGASRKQLYVRIFRRLGLLLFLGLIYNGLFQSDWHHMRLAGVLQRIAICYFFAALIVVNFKVKAQAVIAGVLLLGYWGAMTLIPVPGAGAGVLTPAGNLSGYIDRQLLPGGYCCFGFGDSEGLFSTIPAIGTTLLGVLAGHWLRTPRLASRKAAGLVLAGIGSLALGALWGHWFPIIKMLWTSSYVLFAAGWSMLLLALFYWIIDIRGYRRWAFFFIVIGSNAITLYVLHRFISLNMVLEHLDHPRGAGLGPYWLFFWCLIEVAVGWLFLWALFRKKLFLRV